MKKTVKLLFLSILQFFVFTNSGFSQEAQKKNWGLNIEPLFGMQNGKLGEYVYSVKDPSYKISELEWPVKKVFYGGADIEGNWKNISAYTGFKKSIPSDSGKMKDYDWLNETDHSMKTNYSISDNKIVENYSFNFGLKYDFNVLKNLKISPAGEFEYKFISFKARNAEGWYGDKKSITDSKDYWWYEPEAKHFTKDSLGAIDYKRQSWSFLLGFNLEYKPVEKLILSADFLLSPWTESTSFDTHWGVNAIDVSGTDYADDVFNYFSSFRISGNVSYCFTDRISSGLKGTYFYLAKETGTNYSKSTSESGYGRSTTAKGGSSEYNFSLELYTKVRIF